MPNTGGYFLESITTNNTTSAKKMQNSSAEVCNNKDFDSNLDKQQCKDNEMEIELPQENLNDINLKQQSNVQENELNSNDNGGSNIDNDDDDDDDDHFDERLVVDYENPLLLAHRQQQNMLAVAEDDGLNSKASTPKRALNEDDLHLNSNNLSPILNTPRRSINKSAAVKLASFKNIDENEDEDETEFTLEQQMDLKRKRESFDSVSLISVDSSFALPVSNKKPKLIRTGSITRSIKRSMSFVAVRTPISKMLRPRRSSVALEGNENPADLTSIMTGSGLQDPNDSFSSIASVESTFNESICKPVKEKFRTLRNRITRSSSNNKKDKYIINVPPTTPEKDDTDHHQKDDEGFKTPKAPTKFSFSAAKSSLTPKSLQKSNKLNQNKVIATSNFNSNTNPSTITCSNSSTTLNHSSPPNSTSSAFTSLTTLNNCKNEQSNDIRLEDDSIISQMHNLQSDAIVPCTSSKINQSNMVLSYLKPFFHYLFNQFLRNQYLVFKICFIYSKISHFTIIFVESSIRNYAN